jgi:SHS2 domain-containing protein
MDGYELLDHTADTGFRVRAASLEELFARAAEALVSIAVDASRSRPEERRLLECPAPSLEDGLVNWLNEVLWLLDGERFVPARFGQIVLEGGSVTGEVWGEARDDARHPPRIVVKAATFHQLAIREQNGVWEAEVFLDI